MLEQLNFCLSKMAALFYGDEWAESRWSIQLRSGDYRKDLIKELFESLMKEAFLYTGSGKISGHAIEVMNKCRASRG